ncbi:uncharacterized protein LOC117892957 isoform X1 [Drosophila subobscura]|uniref:uncharacterized protein LOC117892957 isoform X1 n=1 Tax=Drosophila subobscura TaxID=7241 RepID=UPI00155A5D3B|nr:uncharacterized protein LOC117892957 isoform X1 [Drosophila subobscura]
MTSPISTAVQRRRQLLHSVESLRGRVRQVLKCVINLHIEFLVLESDVAALLDEVRALNDDHEEMQRLDRLIETLRDYSGPTICHEWPYPLIFKGTIDEAHVAQILNGGSSELEVPSSYPREYNMQLESNTDASKRSRFLRFPRKSSSSRRLQSAD